MDIFLIRHTTPAISLEYCYGKSDVELAGTFDQEAEDVRRRLCPDGNMIFYSSPLKRCRLLAAHLAQSAIGLDARLQEFDFGAYELQRWDALDPVSAAPWMQDFVNTRAPGGESFQDLHDRCLGFIQELLQKEDQKVVLVTHGGVIRVMVAWVLGVPLCNIFKMQIDFGSISRIKANGADIKVTCLNR